MPRNEKGQPQDHLVLRRLWEFLAEDRAVLLVVLAFAMGLGVLTLATPIAVQSLVNFVAFGGLMQPLLVVGLLLLAVLGFAGAIRVFKSYVVEILQRRFFHRIVTRLSARLPRVRLEAHDRGHGPELVNRFFDVLTVQKSGSTLLIDGLDIVLQATIGLLVLGFYHPFLLIFDVGLILGIAFVLFGLGRGAVASAKRESGAKYRVAAALQEIARAPVTYKLAGAAELAESRLEGLTGDYLDARQRHYGFVFRQLIGAVSLHALAATALLSLGGYLVIQGQLTLGQLVAAELIVSVALVSFVKFGKQLESFYDLLAGVDKLGVLFDLPIEEDHGELHEASARGASLELRHVSYSFPAGPEVLCDTSLKVQAGERVALFGRRGSGKSTLAETLCGLRQPSSGAVLFDGTDIRGISDDCLRHQINLVSGFEIVDGTILENLRLCREDISLPDVQDALARVGILDELNALPDGLRTELTVDGAPLSRTTAVLLMVARAIVTRPVAIVVDSVLDELGSASLGDALRALADPEQPWTLLVLTAREDVAAPLARRLELESPIGNMAGGVA